MKLYPRSEIMAMPMPQAKVGQIFPYGYHPFKKYAHAVPWSSRKNENLEKYFKMQQREQ